MTMDHTSINSSESAAICPLCGQPNHCAIVAGTDPAACWCTGVTIDRGAREQALSTDDGHRCLCARCGLPARESTS